MNPRRHNTHHSLTARQLIVNADDFGLSDGINAGIIKAHDDGIVTSASLMVRAASALHAVEFAGQRPQLSLGLHVDLGEWMYRDTGWQLIDFVVDVDDQREVEREVTGQIEHFISMTGHLPTHLDSHQHVHRNEPVLSVMQAHARCLGIPLRHFSQQVAYRGDFYGQTGLGISMLEAITPTSLINILKGLPPGITELACHPGNDDALQTMYLHERQLEVEALCDPEVRSAIEAFGIQLISFHDVAEFLASPAESCVQR
jgi:chitin disaccharide deacetylase